MPASCIGETTLGSGAAEIAQSQCRKTLCFPGSLVR
jgi:hypothetical protein